LWKAPIARSPRSRSICGNSMRWTVGMPRDPAAGAGAADADAWPGADDAGR
jgi:hypothetical protein